MKENRNIFYIGDKVNYLGKEAIIEAIVLPAIDPVASPAKCMIDLNAFNYGTIGGGVRDEISYLISIPGKDYRDGTGRKERQLLWPRLEHLKRIRTEIKPKRIYRKNKERSLH